MCNKLAPARSRRRRTTEGGGSHTRAPRVGLGHCGGGAWTQIGHIMGTRAPKHIERDRTQRRCATRKGVDIKEISNHDKPGGGGQSLLQNLHSAVRAERPGRWGKTFSVENVRRPRIAQRRESTQVSCTVEEGSRVPSGRTSWSGRPGSCGWLRHSTRAKTNWMLTVLPGPPPDLASGFRWS